MAKIAYKGTDPTLAAAAEAGASHSDLDLIATLKSRVADFNAARDELQRMGAAVAHAGNVELEREYGRLVGRAEQIQSQIDAALGAVDSALKWARAAIGLEGLRSLSAMGVAWFLPAAVLVGAIAVIGYFLTDYIKFAKRFNEQTRITQELVAAGIDPATAQRQAAETVAAAAPGFSFGGFSQPLMLGLLATLGVLLWTRYRQP